MKNLKKTTIKTGFEAVLPTAKKKTAMTKRLFKANISIILILFLIAGIVYGEDSAKSVTQKIQSSNYKEAEKSVLIEILKNNKKSEWIKSELENKISEGILKQISFKELLEALNKRIALLQSAESLLPIKFKSDKSCRKYMASLLQKKMNGNDLAFLIREFSNNSLNNLEDYLYLIFSMNLASFEDSFIINFGKECIHKKFGRKEIDSFVEIIALSREGYGGKKIIREELLNGVRNNYAVSKIKRNVLERIFKK